MKKLLRVAIPFLTVCLIFGGLHYLVGVGMASALSESISPQGSIVVNTLEDELNTDGDCSLREAVAAANDNIEVDACAAGDAFSTDTLSFGVQGTILVSSQISITTGGPLLIDGGDVITASGGGTTRIWWVDTGSVLTLSNLVMVNGESDEGGSLYNHFGYVTIIGSTFSENQGAEGGVIYNTGTVHIFDSLFNNNNAPAVGGSILNDGIMTISNSSFTGNTSHFSCGAIDNWASLTITDSEFINNSTDYDCGGVGGGRLNITHSLFSGNSASTGGGLCLYEGSIVDSIFTGNSATMGGGIAGGYQGEGEIYIVNSTISGNTASTSGGGIYDEGVITVINSTISGNSSPNHGGGISISAAGFIPSTLLLSYSTVSNNSSPTGGGIYNNGNTTLSSAIIANNPGGDCVVNNGSVTDGGHNLDSDGTCGLSPANSSLPATNPKLGPLQDNGGPTFTQALLPGSPAIDKGKDDTCPQYDQRGMYRPIDGDGNSIATCDIGSFEAAGSLLTVTTLADELANDGYCSLREAIQAANTNSAVDACGSGNLIFDMIIFKLPGTISLTDPLTVTNSGELMIYGGDMISIDGAGLIRVMAIDPGATLSLWNLTLANGNYDGYGAGLYNNGHLSIAESTITGNHGEYGGGIYNLGSLTITRSTFYGNSAFSGGGIANWGTLDITNSTISENYARDWAGGIDNWGTMTLLNTTIAQNAVSDGAGAGIYASNLGSTTIKNTIVADNLGGDCFGTTLDGGHNLDSDNTCNLSPANGSLPNTDPLLAPLDQNGGPTLTQPLLSNSPAIDAGANAQCPATDQRGYPRPMDGNGDGVPVCDMGAFEDNYGYLVVDTLEDTEAADGYCSLREALKAANTNSLVEVCGRGDTVMDKITFAVDGIINVTSELKVLPAGALIVDGGDTITISAGGSESRVWSVDVGSELRLKRLTVADADQFEDYGGGIYNDAGLVVVSDCKFLNNSADYGGSGIYNLGTLVVSDTIFSNNAAEGSLGGAITNVGSLTVSTSTISNNMAYVCAGIENEGVGVIRNSTLSGNYAYWNGAGLCNHGDLSIINSTISGNTISEGSGGGISNTGTLSLINDTIAANNAPAGGGINGGAGITMINTIIANNLGGDCGAPVIDGGHNLDSDNSCGLSPANGSLPATNPHMGPLESNGGPTHTHELLEGSPAIDAGDNDQCPATDQRGILRPTDGNGDGNAQCDIGAYEFVLAAQWNRLPIIFRSP